MSCLSLSFFFFFDVVLWWWLTVLIVLDGIGYSYSARADEVSIPRYAIYQGGRDYGRAEYDRVRFFFVTVFFGCWNRVSRREEVATYDRMKKHYEDPTFEVVSGIFRALSKKKIVGAGSFQR